MRVRELSLPLVSFSVALLAACEPDLSPLTSRYGFGGASGSNEGGADMGGSSFGGLSGSGGKGGTSSTEGGNASGGNGTQPDTCSDMRRNADESDVDCGGTSLCGPCELFAHCTRHADCQTAVCYQGRCSEPSCTDLVLNQNETDTDCGGVCAPAKRCEESGKCLVHTDCVTDYCASGACEDHCISKRKDSDETDVDCGGSSCAPCATGKACLETSDCVSNVCKNNKCVEPSCDDDVRNQDETDVDCGGVCAETRPCTPGDSCSLASDCDSYICTANKCVKDIVIPPLDVIDDMEDGNLVLPKVGDRQGNWFRFGDGTGTSTFEPFIITGGRAGSKLGLHFTAKDFKGWGCGAGFDFSNPSSAETTKKPWDASAFRGITFWAKAEAAVAVNVQLPDRNTHKSGGICTTCDHHWAKFLQIGTQWTRFTVWFNDLTLEPGTEPPPVSFDKSGVVMTQFFFPSGSTVDIMIDDAALVR